MKLSIIVPVYNVEQYIRPCLESVLNQELNEMEYEVILVNDGSQDDSFGQIQDIIDGHRNIIRIDQDNQGLSGARNTGLLHAKGDYILFVDSDDLLVKNSVAYLLQIAENTSADLVVADFLKMSDEDILELVHALVVIEAGGVVDHQLQTVCAVEDLHVEDGL